MTAEAFAVFTKINKNSQRFTKCYNPAMKFSTVIFQDEDKMWMVECPAIPGCVIQGRLVRKQ